MKVRGQVTGVVLLGQLGLYRYKFNSFRQLYECVDDYIRWYNTKRLHSSLGYISPFEMEIKLKGIISKAA